MNISAKTCSDLATEVCACGVGATVTWKASAGYEMRASCTSDAYICRDTEERPFVVRDPYPMGARRRWREHFNHPVVVLCSECGEGMENDQECFVCGSCGRNVWPDGIITTHAGLAWRGAKVAR